MGRHGRDSAHAAGPVSHRRARRRNPVARTGLIGASAAVAVGAVAVATGFLPSPGALTAGRTLRDPGEPGNLGRADGTPTPLASISTGGSAAAPASRGASAAPHVSPTRVTGRPTTPVTRRPTATTTPAPPTRTATATTATAVPTATSRAAAQTAQVLTLVNQQRAQAGCRPLTADARLADMATDYSADMAARGFFDHTDPDGKTPWDRAKDRGITNLGGENIAEGQADAQAVMTAWMNSPGHRANILNCDYRTIGIGVHYAGGAESGGPWWTQDFGF